MIKLICTLLFLVSGYSAYSWNVDLLFSGHPLPETSLVTEEAEELIAGTENESPAAFQKNFHKIKIISGSGFDYTLESSWPSVSISGVTEKIIPSLNNCRIIYPFHSFP